MEVHDRAGDSALSDDRGERYWQRGLACSPTIARASRACNVFPDCTKWSARRLSET